MWAGIAWTEANFSLLIQPAHPTSLDLCTGPSTGALPLHPCTGASTGALPLHPCTGASTGALPLHPSPLPLSVSPCLRQDLRNHPIYSGLVRYHSEHTLPVELMRKSCPCLRVSVSPCLRVSVSPPAPLPPCPPAVLYHLL